MKSQNFFSAYFDGETIYPIVINAPIDKFGNVVVERTRIVRISNVRDLKYPDWQGKSFGPAMNCCVTKTTWALTKARKIASKIKTHSNKNRFSYHYWMRWEYALKRENSRLLSN